MFKIIPGSPYNGQTNACPPVDRISSLYFLTFIKSVTAGTPHATTQILLLPIF